MDKYIYTCIFSDYTYIYASSYTFIKIMWYVQLQEYLYLSIIALILVFTLKIFIILIAITMFLFFFFLSFKYLKWITVFLCNKKVEQEILTLI